MKGILFAFFGGAVGCIIGCQLLQGMKAHAATKSWDGCHIRYVESGNDVVVVHDCNES